MAALSPQELVRLIDRVGSESTIALIANCEASKTQSPVAWRRGSTLPEGKTMQRLEFLKELMDLAAAMKGEKFARNMLFDGPIDNTQLSRMAIAVREGRFADAHYALVRKLSR